MVENNIAEQILKESGYVNPEHEKLVQVNTPSAETATPETPATPAPEAAAQPATPPAQQPQQPQQPAAPAPQQPVAQSQPEQQPTPATPETPQQPQQVATPQEMTEADLLAVLTKKLGREVKSLEELQQPKVLTPEEQKAQAEQKRSEAITYGLKEKLFTHKQVEEHAIEAARDPRETAKGIFATGYIARNPQATQDDINEAFSQWAFESEAEDSPLRQMRQDEIQQMHDAYIKTKYADVLGIENAYDHYNKTIGEAQAYKNAVDNVMTEFHNGGQPYEASFTIGDDKHAYSFKVKPEIVAEVEKQFLGQNMFNVLGKENLNSDVLKESIKNAILIRELPRILNEVAESHKARALLDAKAGRINVPPTREHLTGPEPQSTAISGPAAAIVREYMPE